MIRVNLLRNRKEGLGRLVTESGQSSSFISGREVGLAGLFLVLGGAILWFVLGRNPETDPLPAGDAAASSAGQPADQAGVTAARSNAGGAAPATLLSPQTAPAAAQPATEPAPRSALHPAGVSSSPSAPAGAVSRPAASALPSSAPSTSAAAPGKAGSRGSTLLAERSSTAPATRPSPQPTPSAAGGVITMRGLSVLGSGNSLQILAATNGQPEYKMFRVENPDRVVIDLAGVRHEIPREYREQKLSNSIVREVRVAQNQIDPPLVRMVLEVQAFPEMQVLARPDGLLINVTGK